MFRFIKYFIGAWKDYPSFLSFSRELEKKNPGKLKKMEKADLKCGIKPYSGRFDFAIRNAKIKYRHKRGCR